MITPNRLIAYTIKAALSDQTEIGWPNSFRGFLSDTCLGIRYIRQYFDSYELAVLQYYIIPPQGDTGAPKVLHRFVGHACNTILHEAIIETEAIANVGINAEIRTLYQVIGGRRYFAISLDKTFCDAVFVDVADELS